MTIFTNALWDLEEIVDDFSDFHQTHESDTFKWQHHLEELKDQVQGLTSAATSDKASQLGAAISQGITKCLQHFVSLHSWVEDAYHMSLDHHIGEIEEAFQRETSETTRGNFLTMKTRLDHLKQNYEILVNQAKGELDFLCKEVVEKWSLPSRQLGPPVLQEAKVSNSAEEEKLSSELASLHHTLGFVPVVVGVMETMQELVFTRCSDLKKDINLIMIYLNENEDRVSESSEMSVLSGSEEEEMNTENESAYYSDDRVSHASHSP